MLTGTLTPAYGQDYKSKKELLADWIGGKDFMLDSFNGSGLCSIRDTTDNPVVSTLSFRYKGNREQTIVKKTKDGWK